MYQLSLNPIISGGLIVVVKNFESKNQLETQIHQKSCFFLSENIGNEFFVVTMGNWNLS